MLDPTSPLGFAVLALSAFRLTRLVVTDSLLPIRAARDAIVRRAGKDSLLAELASCPWCSGFWVSLGVIASALAWPPVMYAWAVLAVAAVVGLVATWEDRT